MRLSRILYFSRIRRIGKTSIGGIARKCKRKGHRVRGGEKRVVLAIRVCIKRSEKAQNLNLSKLKRKLRKLNRALEYLKLSHRKQECFKH